MYESPAKKSMHAEPEGGTVPLLSFFSTGPKPGKLLFHAGMNASGGEFAILVAFSGRDAGQYLDAFINTLHGIDMEFSLADRFNNIMSEHQVADILDGDQNSLGSGKAPGLADVVEPLDLLVHTADWLNLPALINRAGDGKILSQRNS